MHKTNLKNKKISDSFPILLALIIFSININSTYSSYSNLIEVSKTYSGKQYWDINSLVNKDKGVIEISTKYFKLDSNGLGKFEKNSYTMGINCITNRYNDISVNGKININAKWEDPNEDKLINYVITESYKNV